MKRINAAIAVIVKDGKILVCQRKDDDTFGGFWEFPGGKCEDGETLEECLIREIREEIDLVVKPIDRLRPIHHDSSRMQLTLHPFLCNHISGEPKLIECQDARWIDAQQLAEFRFPPANEPLLDEVRKRLKPAAGSL